MRAGCGGRIDDAADPDAPFACLCGLWCRSAVLNEHYRVRHVRTLCINGADEADEGGNELAARHPCPLPLFVNFVVPQMTNLQEVRGGA